MTIRPVLARPKVIPSPPSDLLSITQAADLLNVGERMVRRLVSERRLPYVKVGRHVRICVADVEALITEGRVEASRPVVTGGAWS